MAFRLLGCELAVFCFCQRVCRFILACVRSLGTVFCFLRVIRVVYWALLAVGLQGFTYADVFAALYWLVCGRSAAAFVFAGSFGVHET